MKKILYVFGSFGSGGTEHHFIDILKRLDKNRFSPAVFVISKDDNFTDEITKTGTGLYMIGKKRGLGLPGGHLVACFFSLIKLILKEKYDIVHTFFFWGHILGTIAARFSGVKIVFANREDTGIWITHNFQIFMLRLINKFVNKIICIASFIAQIRKEKEGISDNKLLVIHNGIAIEAPQNYEPYIRNEFGIPSNSFVICTIANMHHPVKGYPYLIEAAAILCAKIPDIVFIFVGDGKLRKEFKSLACKTGFEKSIIFAGHRNDVKEILRESDLFSLFSLSEGLPISILEAMSEKKAILASRVGGVPEIVQDGKTGLLIESKDIAAFVEKTTFLYMNRKLLSTYGEAGFQRAKNEFDIDKVVKKYENLYSNN